MRTGSFYRICSHFFADVTDFTEIFKKEEKDDILRWTGGKIYVSIDRKRKEDHGRIENSPWHPGEGIDRRAEIHRAQRRQGGPCDRQAEAILKKCKEAAA